MLCLRESPWKGPGEVPEDNYLKTSITLYISVLLVDQYLNFVSYKNEREKKKKGITGP